MRWNEVWNEDTRETICRREREWELEILKVWKIEKRKWENIKKTGTLENMNLGNIRKIENMESLKNAKLEIWKMLKKIIEMRGEAM